MRKNIILVDADYLDHVVFDLVVNFERMIGRQIPPADLAHWLDCIALDGGLRAGDNEIQVFFIHDKEKKELQNFSPSVFAEDLHEKAFRDHLGEFVMAAFPVENIISKEDFMFESFEALLLDTKTERIMLIADFDGTTPESQKFWAKVQKLCANPPCEREDGQKISPKSLTLFAMQALSGRGFKQEILGYSLMAALGIKSSEF